ncbi:hypothetical protein LOK49_Contig57G00007 [Camellia lanceoleosa]|nr:hypothetical protein LOK49_Contig57G00007 [Camellia lanceoleosa]
MITKKNTQGRFRLKFMRSVWLKPRKTLTSKHTHKRVIRCFVKQ